MKIRSVLIAIVVLLTACYTVDNSNIKNLNNGKIKTIGHGGAGFPSIIPFNALPTNTIAGLKKAIEIGNADGVELDIHMTADFDFIVYHDKALDSKTDKSGYIEELEMKELLGIPYKLGFPYDMFQSESIISLDNVINYFQSLEQFPILHLDIRNYCEKFISADNDVWEDLMAKKLVERLEEYQLNKNNIHLISISKKMCFFFKNNSHFKVSLELYNPIQDLDWVIENKIHSVTVKSNKLTKEISERAHLHGIEIIAFGTRSKSGNAKLIEMNPDYIQTDNLVSLNELINQE